MTWFSVRCVALACVLSFDLVCISGMMNKHNRNHTSPELPEVDVFDPAIKSALPPKARESFHERGCNILYHAIVHVHLCRSIKPAELRQHVTVLEFHLLAIKMLATMSYSSLTRRMMGPMWVLFLYSYKMRKYYQQKELSVAAAALESVHDETFELLRSTLQQDCRVLETLDGPERDYRSYMADITGERDVSKLKKNARVSYMFLAYDSDQAKVLARRNLLTRDQLYLNNVFANDDVMDTLIAKFGLIDNCVQLKAYFDGKYKTLLDSKSLLGELRCLYDVQLHFTSLLKIMMVRLCLNHLAHVEGIENVDRRYKYNSMVGAKFDEFTLLLSFTDDDEVLLFVDLFKTQTHVDRETVKDLISKGKLVLKYLGVHAVEITCSDARLVEKPIGTVKRLADSNGLKMSTVTNEKQRSLTSVFPKISAEYDSVENSVRRVNFFVDYLKKKLSGNDFFIIRFFMNTFAL